MLVPLHISHVPPQPTTLTWTGVRTARECWRAFWSRFVAQIEPIAAVELERGSGVHEILHAVGLARFEGREMDDEQITALIERHAAVLLPEAADDLRAISRRAIERDYLPTLPSDATDVGFERAFAIDASGKPVMWDSAAAIFRSIFDVAFRENGGTLGVVDDYKTSRLITAPGEQMRLYAWAMTCLYPDLEEVLVRLRYVRYGVTKEQLYDAEALAELRRTVPVELAALRDEVARRREAQDWPTRVTVQACNSCAYGPTCPEREASLGPLATESSRALADRLVTIEAEAAQIKEALKGRVERDGPQDLGGGEVYGPIAKQRQSVADAALAANVFTDLGVPTETLWEHVGLTSGAINKLTTAAIADAPRKEKKDARERVMQQLRGAGVFKVETFTTVGRFAKSDETPAEEEAA